MGEAMSVDLKNASRVKRDPEHPLHREIPHAYDAEAGLVGCMLLSPNTVIGDLVAKNKSGAEVLHDLRLQTIYGVMVRMYDHAEPIDIITVQQKLADRQMLEQIGGIPYLNALQDGVPSAANVDYYLEIVLEKFRLRRMIHTCTDVIGRVYDCDGDVDALQDQVESDILTLRDDTEGTTEYQSAKQLVPGVITAVEQMFNQRGAVSGIATGFADFDKMTDGLHGGEMIVIAGRPSTGKTSLAMNIAEHVALNLKLPVGVFSLEMSAEQLMTRAAASLARVNLRAVREGFMSERDFPKLRIGLDKLMVAPLYIDDAPGLSIMQLRSRARRMFQQLGIKLFVVDYLQLMHSTAQRSKENRQQEIADISGGVKALAKELKVPILALSQMNREFEKDKNRKPRMSDLRESGALEQDADLVGLLYKPSKGDDDSQEESDGIAVNLLIAKQRNGPTGDCHLTFLKTLTRFESASRVECDE
jgi:replicative DNA helicase